MELRITITISEHGADPANLERVLEAFLDTAAEAGPVVDANTASGTLAVTYTIDEETLEECKDATRRVFVGGMEASGLPKTDIVDVEIEDIGAAAELHRELQPA